MVQDKNQVMYFTDENYTDSQISLVFDSLTHIK